MKATIKRQAGLNIFELLLLAAMVGIALGVAIGIAQRFGWLWGALAFPATLVIIFASYALLYWAVGFLPHRLGGPPAGAKKPQRSGTSDSIHVP